MRWYRKIDQSREVVSEASTAITFNITFKILEDAKMHHQSAKFGIYAQLTILLLFSSPLSAIGQANRPEKQLELSQIKEMLKQYYSTLESSSIVYDQSSTIQNVEYAEESRKRAIAAREALIPKALVAEKQKLSPSIEDDSWKLDLTKHFSIQLLDKFPSIKYQETMISGIGKSEHKEKVEKYLHNNVYTEIKEHHRYAATTKTIKQSNLPFLTPINAMGKRIVFSVNQSIEDLLRSPDAKILTRTIRNGDELIEVQAGPDFGEKIQPHNLPEGGYLTMILNKSTNWMPEDIIFHLDNAKVYSEQKKRTGLSWNHTIKLSNYREVAEPNGKDKILFPHHISYKDFGNLQIFDIKKIQINIPLSDADFRPNIPKGFSHTIDGVVPITSLTGGIKEQQKTLKRVSERAKLILNTPTASPSPKTFMHTSDLNVLIVISVFSVITIVVFLFFLWRRKNA